MKKGAYEVSYYLSVKDTVGRNVSFCEILDWIKSNQFKEKVRKIRKLLKEAEEIGVKITEKPSNITDEEREKLSKDKEEREKMAGEVKKSLPGFTASGVFINGRKAKNLKEYSGRIILDFDHTSDQTEMYKAKAKEIPFTECVFISPSGEGLKIIVHVNSGPEEHKKMFEAVRGFYEKELGFSVDPSGKDVSRLCFLAWDEDAYYNPDSKIFTWEDAPEVGNLVSITAKESPEKQEISAKEWKEIFSGEDLEKRIDYILTYGEKKYDFTPGNRNSSLFKLACFVNELGIPEREFINEAGKRFSASDFPLSEIEATIEHVYKDKAAKFGEKNEVNSVMNDKNDKNDIVDEDLLLRSMPYISDEVFENLPEVLKKPLTLTKNKRERDTLFLGLLVMLGGCMPTVYSRYSNRDVFPHFFGFVTAPAASGKGVLNYASRLIEDFNRLIYTESKKELKEYKRELKKREAEAKKNGGEAEHFEELEEVHLKLLLLPPRVSRSAMLHQFENNGDMGMVIFAPEADALINSNKADCGKFDECIRQAFHHESVTSLYRVDNMNPVIIKNPKLAMLVSGTKDQFLKFFPSAENGTFSRFVFYGFSTSLEWINQFDDDNGEDIISSLAKKFCEQADSLRNGSLKIVFTEKQKKDLNETQKYLLSKYEKMGNKDCSSILKRHALVWVRICMILTALRKCEHPLLYQDVCECSQEDFERGKSTILCLVEHAMFLVSTLCGPKRKFNAKKASEALVARTISTMPPIFSTLEFAKKVKGIISVRTVQRILPQFNEVLVNSLKNGRWEKIEK